VLPEAAVAEVRRNLAAKLPEAAPLFEEFLRAVPLEIHRPTSHGRERARGLADTKDVAILTAAIGAGARLLVTHNVRHLRLGQGVRVVRPRTLMEEVRAWLSSFGT
jgi:predicted nucleic acid-binding protein